MLMTIYFPSLEEQKRFVEQLEQATPEEQKELLRKQFGDRRRKYEVNMDTMHKVVNYAVNHGFDIDVFINKIIHESSIQENLLKVQGLNVILDDQSVKKIKELSERAPRKRGKVETPLSVTRILDEILRDFACKNGL